MTQRLNRRFVGQLMVVTFAIAIGVSGTAFAQTWQALGPVGLGDPNNAGAGTTIIFNSMLYIGT